MIPEKSVKIRGKSSTLRACTVLVLTLSLSVASMLRAENSETLPSFTLPDLDGKQWSSEDFKGKPVIFDFWATWCTVCEETIPKLSELSKKYKNKGLTVVGISVDKGSQRKIQRTAKKWGIDYLVLHDKENTLGSVFGFSGIPSVYVFDRKGKRTLAMPGYDPDHDEQLDAAAEKAL